MDIIWIGAAFLLGFGVSRLHIPPLVGYLIAGLALSLWGYEAGSMMKELSHLGVIFLLFTVGLHIRLKNIIAVEVFGPGLIHMAISTAIFTPIALYFGFEIQAALIVAITLGFSSTVLAAKTLERRNELGSYYGRIAIGILIIQDLIAIGIIAYTGGGIPSFWAITLFGLPLLRPVIAYLFELLKDDELVLLFALVLALGGASLFEFFNLSGELGALAIGMLLATNDRSGQLEKKLWSVKEAFLVAFFLEVGLTGFPNSSELNFIFIVILLLPFKSALFFLLFSLFRLRARTSFLSTLSLTAYSEFTLIAGIVAVSNGFLPESIMVSFGLIVAISYTINAPLTIIEDKIWRFSEKFLKRFERDEKLHDKQSISLGAAEYLVIGMGDAGIASYDELKKSGKQVVGMDIDPDRIEKNLKKGRRILYGDIQDTQLWDNINLSKIKSVIIAMGNKLTKTNATLNLRNSGYNNSIYVLTMRPDETQALQDAGASAVSIPIREAGQRLALLSMVEGDEVPSIDVDVNPPDGRNDKN